MAELDRENAQDVPWCTAALSNPVRLQEIYSILAKRERKRRSCQSSSSQNAYRVDNASTGVNKLKNRYFDILPYDSSRVCLPKRLSRSDYINASWILEPGFDLSGAFEVTNFAGGPYAPKRWIASQGPKRETRYEFLSLFLNPDQNSRPRTIIQLTACQEGNREKSAPYVPSKTGETVHFSAYSLFAKSYADQPARADSQEDDQLDWMLLNSNNDPDRLTYPTISVTLEQSCLGPSNLQSSSSGTVVDESKSFYKKNILTIALGLTGTQKSPVTEPELMPRCRVTHYECVDWPDRGTPEAVEPILKLIQVAERESLEASTDETIRKTQPHSAPILVHCSAGVGRTGTLIAIASSIRRLHLISHSCKDFRTFSSQRKAATLSNFTELGRTELPGLRLPGLPDPLGRDLVARTVDYLREQRVCMVQTDKQLAFVYKAVAKVLKLLIHSIL